MNKIHTKNGLTLDGIFIRNLPHVDGFLFYCQDRLVMTDNDYNEIKSLDVVQFIMTKADILRLSTDKEKMINALTSWMEV